MQPLSRFLSVAVSHVCVTVRHAVVCSRGIQPSRRRETKADCGANGRSWLGRIKVDDIPDLEPVEHLAYDEHFFSSVHRRVRDR
jgi:hypothetical protein